MHISVIKSKQGQRVYYGKLLRRSYRDENGKSQKETVANLSALDDGAIEVLRAYYSGKKLVQADAQEPFTLTKSLEHGPVLAVSKALEKLGLPQMISHKACRERQIVCAMIAARLIKPGSKLDSLGWWENTSLPEEFSIPRDIEVEKLYGAMDWLIKRQDRIQQKLAQRHLSEGCIALYDLSSSYYEGSKCPLAKPGYSRDKKRGKTQINYGLLCDALGRPISLSVYDGNINDHKTLMTEVERIQNQFSLSSVVLVGDRGMMVKTDLQKLKQMDNIHWITALHKSSIRKLLKQSTLDFSKPEDPSICQIHHPDFEGERLIACFNRALKKHLSHKRMALIEKTEEALAEIVRRIENGTIKGNTQLTIEAKIADTVASMINKFKVKKYFEICIREGALSYVRRQDMRAEEESLDGITIFARLCPNT